MRFRKEQHRLTFTLICTNYISRRQGKNVFGVVLHELVEIIVGGSFKADDSIGRRAPKEFREGEINALKG